MQRLAWHELRGYFTFLLLSRNCARQEWKSRKGGSNGIQRMWDQDHKKESWMSKIGVMNVDILLDFMCYDSTCNFNSYFHYFNEQATGGMVIIMGRGIEFFFDVPGSSWPAWWDGQFVALFREHYFGTFGTWHYPSWWPRGNGLILVGARRCRATSAVAQPHDQYAYTYAYTCMYVPTAHSKKWTHVIYHVSSWLYMT